MGKDDKLPSISELFPVDDGSMATMRRELLQGEAAWNHFLEAKYKRLEPEGDEHVEIDGTLRPRRDVNQKSDRFRAIAKTTTLCSACRKPGPADLTFCVFCGSDLERREASRSQALQIEEIADRELLDDVARVLDAANDGLSRAEIDRALSEPPAVFHFYGDSTRAQALAGRLSELGALTTIQQPGDPGVGWAREVIESMLRRPSDGLPWLGAIVVATIVGVAVHPVVAAVALAIAVVSLGRLQYRQFLERYDVDAYRVTNALNGMEPDSVEACRRVLRELGAGPVRDELTICLMEYYAIWKHLNSADPQRRWMLRSLSHGLHDLMAQTIELSARYLEVAEFLKLHDRAEIEARISELEAHQDKDDALSRIHARELPQRQRQLELVAKMEIAAQEFEERITLMGASMESLRVRLVTASFERSMPRGAVEEEFILDLLEGLDDEAAVFDEALSEVELHIKL